MLFRDTRTRLKDEDAEKREKERANREGAVRGVSDKKDAIIGCTKMKCIRQPRGIIRKNYMQLIIVSLKRHIGSWDLRQLSNYSVINNVTLRNHVDVHE